MDYNLYFVTILTNIIQKYQRKFPFLYHFLENDGKGNITLKEHAHPLLTSLYNIKLTLTKEQATTLGFDGTTPKEWLIWVSKHNIHLGYKKRIKFVLHKYLLMINEFIEKEIKFKAAVLESVLLFKLHVNKKDWKTEPLLDYILSQKNKDILVMELNTYKITGGIVHDEMKHPDVYNLLLAKSSVQSINIKVDLVYQLIQSYFCIVAESYENISRNYFRSLTKSIYMDGDTKHWIYEEYSGIYLKNKIEAELDTLVIQKASENPLHWTIEWSDIMEIE